MRLSIQKKYCQTGFSLFELLVCIAILALLLAVAQPPLAEITKKTKIRRAARDYMTAMETARATAISENTFVTFCRSYDLTTCSGQWHQGAIVFTDQNRNRIIDDSDRIIHVINRHPETIIRLSAFGNRQFLQFGFRGMLHYQSGRLTLCPTDNDITAARQLIINAIGRVRQALDTDEDGVVENAYGDPVVCD